jgi:hypothetical protein
MKTALSAAIVLLITSIPIVGHADEIPFYDTDLTSSMFYLDCNGPFARHGFVLVKPDHNRFHFYSAKITLFFKPYGHWHCQLATTNPTTRGSQVGNEIISTVDFTVCDRPQNEISLTVQPDVTLHVNGGC